MKRTLVFIVLITLLVGTNSFAQEKETAPSPKQYIEKLKTETDEKILKFLADFGKRKEEVMNQLKEDIGVHLNLLKEIVLLAEEEGLISKVQDYSKNYLEFERKLKELEALPEVHEKIMSRFREEHEPQISKFFLDFSKKLFPKYKADGLVDEKHFYEIKKQPSYRGLPLDILKSLCGEFFKNAHCIFFKINSDKTELNLYFSTQVKESDKPNPFELIITYDLTLNDKSQLQISDELIMKILLKDDEGRQDTWKDGSKHYEGGWGIYKVFFIYEEKYDYKNLLKEKNDYQALLDQLEKENE